MFFFFASSTLQANVALPDGLYHQTETEMVIKTAGLNFQVTRTWQQGRWWFNVDWQNLTMEFSVKYCFFYGFIKKFTKADKIPFKEMYPTLV